MSISLSSQKEMRRQDLYGSVTDSEEMKRVEESRGEGKDWIGMMK